MKFIVETNYDQKTLTNLAHALRKELKESKRDCPLELLGLKFKY